MLLLFVLTLFLSSLLMFVLEPMAAKMVLPLLGGAPAVWNTCVVFFQAMLLAGYAYAHGASKWLGVRRHAALHLAVVAIALLGLPFTLSGIPDPDRHPLAWLLLLLLTSIGLPFFAVATTAPLLQKWFSRTRHPSAADPYFLYTASNLGSLAGLAMYPVVIEPLLRLDQQVTLWTIGYGTFVLLTAASAFTLWRYPADSADERSEPGAGRLSDITALRRLRWVALAFAPSSLMLAVTTFVSTDVAAVPLLWVVPLALYLLSFVQAFSPDSKYPRRFVDRSFVLMMLLLVVLFVVRASGPLWLVIPVHIAAFYLAALVCHRALADDRPHPSHITEFYLWIAFGGILGSLFNTLVAPVVFTSVLEYPLVLVAVCLLRSPPDAERRPATRAMFAMAVAAGIVTLLVTRFGTQLQPAALRFGLLGITAFLALSVSRSALPYALTIAFMVVSSFFPGDQRGKVLLADRTFFGRYRVQLGEKGEYRALFHGTTLHGLQSVSQSRRDEPLTYFHRTGPFGDLYSRLTHASSQREMAVIGLGAGSLAAYRRPGQLWTFYEIDPAIEQVARNPAYFTFLQDCGEQCRVVIGDGRLSLARAAGAHFGMITIDAFSSDAIPVHLLTRQSIELYLSKLAPRGVLVFHVSNRHLNLEPVLARLAENLGLTALIRRDRVAVELADGKASSVWAVMARSENDLAALTQDANWVAAKVNPRVKLWTDDYSNILTLLTK